MATSYPIIGKIARKSMIHSKERVSMKNKIRAEHVSRQASVYVRQSTSGQVIHHRESRRLQYRLVDRAKELGWSEENIIVIDSDLGTTAAGYVNRVGFQKLLAAVSDGKVGAIFSIEASRLARNGREWHTLLEVCGIMRTVLVDQEAIYDLNLSNDRLLLGLKGEMSAMELNLLKERSQAAIQHKASRGELYLTLPAAYIKTKDNRLEKNPDRRIQEVTDLVFTKFRQYGTMSRVYKWFLHAKIEIPVVSNGRGERTIEWKLPSKNSILTLLCQIRNRFRSLIIQRKISCDRHSQWTPAYAYAFLRIAVLLPPMWSLYEEVKSLGCKRYRSNSITDNRL
jgi:DNA invertase Pin-like site-specific DNA recombinase